ncbi:hypothetical protein [Flavobacterium sp.]|uniref:hypothetical protein n=1 Tax=Flavobacterium sp. TaxID=239 RepID=UPI00391B7468
MCFQKGNVINSIIGNDHSQYSLLGMISPTFQNQGTAYVNIAGRKVLPGESFSIDCPNVELQNAISINFEADPAKTKILYIGFVKLEKN